MRPDEIKRVQRSGHSIRCAHMQNYLSRIYEPMRASIIAEVSEAAKRGASVTPTLQADAAVLQQAIRSASVNKPDAVAERLFADVTDPANHPLPKIHAGFITGNRAAAAGPVSTSATPESVQAAIAQAKAWAEKQAADEIAQEKAKQASLRAQIEAVRSGNAQPAQVSAAAPEQDDTAATTVQRSSGSRAQAEDEWDTDPSVREGFTSKENYVSYRKAELDGNHRNYVGKPATQLGYPNELAMA